MIAAINILKEALITSKSKEREDIESALKLIHSELYNYDQNYKNIFDIKKALDALERGKTIQNGEGREGFVVYFKIGAKYFTYHSNDAEKITEINFDRLKSHVENHTLECNEGFLIKEA